ncbi:uncharacterized protein LOC128217535 [Mya arenaria]|uniref:uncharacterized protein LOC128217535 n=1 Tax=Mya arenaria TaxID=6604 RepID=UPI0022DF3A1F|nr:uncharacterized protein LOC128217535 [Mya arenaria]
MSVYAVTTARPNVWTWSSLNADQIRAVIGEVEDMCTGNFIGYNRSFALLKEVSVDPKFGHGRKGGEHLSDVINQTEDLEYHTLERGYFKLRCRESNPYHFKQTSHLNDWFNALEFYNQSTKMISTQQRFDKTAITIKRFEYANLYHTMTDFYNAFRRIHQVPFLEEFKSFFLSRHSVHFNDALDCDNLTVILLLRKDYLAHPRNPSGSVSRKIANDKQLIQKLKELLPRHNVLSSQIDLLSMKDQLSLISRTDILIGMHGAGLTHTLFLPKHAGLVELYPNYWPTANEHFQAMARWRNLKYFQWQNADPSNERANNFTVINTTDVVEMVKNIHALMCN